jgi:hypothetical protein
MAYRPDTEDPFNYDRIPSLSWKDLPVGSTFALEVLEPAKSLQTTDFETQQPAFWDAEQTRPKMAAVVNVRVLDGPHSVGEERSIWAQIPSNLFIAIRDAQKAAELKLAPGGTLYLRFTGTKPHENARFSPIKQYEAKYMPPATPVPDPFLHEFAPPTPQAPPQTQPPLEASRTAQEPRRGWDAPTPASPARSGWKR